MNHYGGKELAASFRTVRKNTIQIAEDVPEDKYAFRATPDTRSVAETLVHIAVSGGFQEEVHIKRKLNSLAGFEFLPLMQQAAAEEKAPRTKQQIIELLRTGGEKWGSWLEGLDDNFLAETVAMPPNGPAPSRTRFDMLLSMKEHEMHHRAQLMLIERMIGIVPHLTKARQAFMANATAASAKT